MNHLAIATDQACSDLGAADINPDTGLLVAFAQVETKRAAAKSAAPIIPASLPNWAITMGGTNR